MRKGDSIALKVEVRNTGDRKESEIVQLYIQDVVASISRPVKELKGFQKVDLMPGESKEVTFFIHEELLKFYNSDLEYVSEHGTFKAYIGPNSRDVQSLTFEFK